MAEYISREAVLKAFKLIAKNPNKDYQRGMQDTIDCLVPEVIAGIPAADVQPVNQWISVDDKLPDTVDDCLVWYSCNTAFGKSKSVGISFCSRDDWYKNHLNGDNIVVLYWMPLPEPPKDGDTNG